MRKGRDGEKKRRNEEKNDVCQQSTARTTTAGTPHGFTPVFTLACLGQGMALSQRVKQLVTLLSNFKIICSREREAIDIAIAIAIA